jgi:hypothetical protein
MLPYNHILLATCFDPECGPSLRRYTRTKYTETLYTIRLEVSHFLYLKYIIHIHKKYKGVALIQEAKRYLKIVYKVSALFRVLV